MAQRKPELIGALRETATRLSSGVKYEWGHMGRCNCGHLVQTLTEMSDYEIVKSIDFKLDEWSEHAQDYCEGTGHKVDDLFITLQNIGFGWNDVVHLENLSDKRVLCHLGQGTPRYLRRNKREDVVDYMNALADVLEENRDQAVLPVAEEAELIAG